MAININPGSPLRHVATFNASGNWVGPSGTNIAFVAIHSATGGGGGSGSYQQNQSPGGIGAISGAFVQVTPGATHSVTVGAGGAGGTGGCGPNNTGFNSGATGGSSSFDGVFTQPGSGGGLSTGRYNQTAGATAAAGTGTTSLTALSPGGALARVATISSQNTGSQTRGASGNGNNRYANGNAGGAGSSGQINIYI